MGTCAVLQVRTRDIFLDLGQRGNSWNDEETGKEGQMRKWSQMVTFWYQNGNAPTGFHVGLVLTFVPTKTQQLTSNLPEIVYFCSSPFSHQFGCTSGKTIYLPPMTI